MNTCKDCKWWRDGWWAYNGHLLKECHLIKDPDSPIVPASDGGEELSLMTRPDFGCIKWEAKDEVQEANESEEEPSKSLLV